MDRTTIGKFIQAERKKQNISQEALADKVQASRQTIISIEKGTANFAIDLFLAILDTLCADFELKPDDNSVSVDAETTKGVIAVIPKKEPNTIYLYDFRKVDAAVPEEAPEPIKIKLPTPAGKRNSKSSNTFW